MGPAPFRASTIVLCFEPSGQADVGELDQHHIAASISHGTSCPTFIFKTEYSKLPQISINNGLTFGQHSSHFISSKGNSTTIEGFIQKGSWTTDHLFEVSVWLHGPSVCTYSNKIQELVEHSRKRAWSRSDHSKSALEQESMTKPAATLLVMCSRKDTVQTLVFVRLIFFFSCGLRLKFNPWLELWEWINGQQEKADLKRIRLNLCDSGGPDHPEI